MRNFFGHCPLIEQTLLWGNKWGGSQQQAGTGAQSLRPAQDRSDFGWNSKAKMWLLWQIEVRRGKSRKCRKDLTVCAKGCCKGRLAGFLFEESCMTMVSIVESILRWVERKLEMLLMITQLIRCSQFVPSTTTKQSVNTFSLSRRWVVQSTGTPYLESYHQCLLPLWCELVLTSQIGSFDDFKNVPG